MTVKKCLLIALPVLLVLIIVGLIFVPITAQRVEINEQLELGDRYLAELDYETEERPDRTVNAPCTVSVRGQGKFRVLSVNDKTRKGRYRLVAEKFL